MNKNFFVHIVMYILLYFSFKLSYAYVPIHYKTKEWITSMKINARISEIKIDLLILYHLLGRMIFVSHYVDDDVTAWTCYNMSYHV